MSAIKEAEKVLETVAEGGNCCSAVGSALCYFVPSPINLTQCFCSCSCGLCCLCIEEAQNYFDNCTTDTITAAAQALLLPPVVSIASKYVQVPDFIVEAAKPPTGQSLLKIKGIIPQVISHNIAIN